MMTKEEIGRIIKESRTAAGLTQLQVGDALKRPQTTIAAWEAGRSQPDANTLFALFQVLGRSVDEAFGFTKKPVALTRLEQAYIQKYRCLDMYDKEGVTSVLNTGFKRFMDSTKTVELPVLTVTIEANGGAYISKNAFKRAIIEDNELTRRAFLCIPVSGVSAEYQIYDGDILLVAEELVENNGIGVFTNSGNEGEGYYHILKWEEGHCKSVSPQANLIEPKLDCTGRIIGKLDPRWVILDDKDML